MKDLSSDYSQKKIIVVTKSGSTITGVSKPMMGSDHALYFGTAVLAINHSDRLTETCKNLLVEFEDIEIIGLL